MLPSSLRRPSGAVRIPFPSPLFLHLSTVHLLFSFFLFFTNLSVNTLDPMIIQVQTKEHLNLISASIKCLVGLCLGADTSILGDSGSLLLLPTQRRHPGAHDLESHLRKAILHKITYFL